MNYRLLFFLIIFISLSSCKPDKRSEFHLPSDVYLNSYGLYDLFAIEHIIDPPFKCTDCWNDSLVKISKIYKIEFKRDGIKNAENIAEKIQWNFTDQGKLKSFDRQNFESSITSKTVLKADKTNENSTNFIVSEYFGQKSDIQILQIIDPLKKIYRRVSGNEIKEENISIYHNNVLIAKVEKHGTFLSKIQFIQDISKPLSDLENLLKSLQINPQDFLLAEKHVTFTDNGLPQKSYLIDENFIKGEISQEWIYQGKNQLVEYKRYIKGTCIKNMKFEYSKNKMLKSLIVDNQAYTLFYN